VPSDWLTPVPLRGPTANPVNRDVGIDGECARRRSSGRRREHYVIVQLPVTTLRVQGRTASTASPPVAARNLP